MSTIIATTLSNGSVSVPTATVVNGSAKAWVNFNGTGTVAIRDSFNVASITDNGTGDYTVNFTAAMGNANYSFTGNGRVSIGVNTCVFPPSNAHYATSSIRGLAITMQDSPIDCDFTNVSIQGDLA